MQRTKDIGEAILCITIIAAFLYLSTSVGMAIGEALKGCA